MDRREELKSEIEEYEDVIQHYENFSLARRGWIGNQPAINNPSKKYSGTKEFISWTMKIKATLSRSELADSDEVKRILDNIGSFKGLAEEEKLKKLKNMLESLYENWDVLLPETDEREDMEQSDIRRVFIVHGHDEGQLNRVKSFVYDLKAPTSCS